MLHGGAWLLADTSWGGGVKGIFQQVGEATLQAEGGGGACLAVDERGVVRRLVGRGLARTWAGGGCGPSRRPAALGLRARESGVTAA